MSREMYRIHFSIERICSPECLGQIMQEAHKWGNIKEALVVKYEDKSAVFDDAVKESMEKYGWLKDKPTEEKT